MGMRVLQVGVWGGLECPLTGSAGTAHLEDEPAVDKAGGTPI